MKSNNRISLTLFVLLCGIVSIIACTKYKDPIYSNDLPSDKLVTTSIQGRVVDENGLPVYGAVVSAGGQDSTTDVDGNFSFKNIEVSSRFGYVKVVKSGYFDGSRSVITNVAGTNYVTINLIPKTLKGTFAASAGGTIVVSTGDTVVYDPSAVITESTGAAYTGTVHVYAAYLGPADADLSKKMPGDLRGIGTDGKETVLQTYGMMVVQMEGDAGEKLQLASGKPARLTMQIPDTLTSSAPSTIPLWYFNDTTGKWIEQGSAAKTGTSYVGTVSHFTWWNCDIAASSVNYKLHLQDVHGIALTHTHIQFSSPSIGAGGTAYTDANGDVSGLLPKGYAFTMQVLNPCGDMEYQQDLGTILADLNLGNVTVDLGTAALILTGTVTDCSNSPVATGYVSVLVDGLSYRAAVSNGVFAMSIARCSAAKTSATLTAGDLGTLQTGQPVELDVTKDSIDVGTLSACGQSIDQYIYVTVNGKNYSWVSPPDNVSLSQSYSVEYVSGSHSGDNEGFRIDMYSPITGTGVKMLDQMHIYNSTVNIGTSFQTQTTQWNITTYGAVGEYIEGSLSGTVYDSVAQASYPMTGSMKVKRTF